VKSCKVGLGRRLGSATGSPRHSLSVSLKEEEEEVVSTLSSNSVSRLFLSCARKGKGEERQARRTWNPVLIAATDLVDAHEEQVMKNRRSFFWRVVSGDLHVLQVTYSTM
jgi:hypothetical protein